MEVGLDIGYGYVKGATYGATTIFPSLAGSATKPRFGMGKADDLYVVVNGKSYAVGDTAIKFSRFDARQESRNWIMSNEWLALAYGALIKLGITGPTSLVVGLPLSYFSDSDAIKERLMGKHEIDHGDTRTYVEIRKVTVVPQPFGALFKQVFLPNGRVREAFVNLLTGRVGIIDLGSNHTNLLEVNGGDTVEAGSDAINMGGWDLCRAVRNHLLNSSTDAELKDHVLSRAIENGQFEHFGEIIELGDIVRPIRDDLVNEVCAVATQLWGNGSGLSAILISGGLAPVVGDAIKSFFNRHKRVIVVNDSQMANARGFLAYGRFLSSS